MQATISSTYQVVIPKQVRENFHLKLQQKLTVIEKDKMLILIPPTSLDSLRGIAAGARIDNYRDKMCTVSLLSGFAPLNQTYFKLNGVK